jgi:tryptophanyl-tRNA synthetase
MHRIRELVKAPVPASLPDSVRIFSGIQPTGRKHLGNFIGAILQYVDGQEQEGESIYCVVDLHATTVAYEPAVLRDRLYDTVAILIAAGIDPDRSILFRQSDVREHSELAWLLSSVTSWGDLNRMHQFKDKAGAQRDLVSAGLFTYPVLMAADVLAYRATTVPVGDDQRQHIELMRDIAQRFNARFGEVLVVPEGVYPEVGSRIMDLQEPTRKMSTTGGTAEGTVYVLDDARTIEKKLKRAVTDSANPPEIRAGADKPGVTNLLEILAAARGTSVADAQASMADARGYGDLKAATAAAVVELLTPVRERYEALRADEAELERILEAGAEKASAITSVVLADVRAVMGVGRPPVPAAR